LRTVTLQTRQPKVKDGYIGLHERWADEATERGVDWELVSTPATVAATASEDRFAVIAAAVSALETSRAHWSYSHLTAGLATAAGQALTPAELRSLADEAIRSERVVALSVPTSATRRRCGAGTARASTATRNVSGSRRSPSAPPKPS
jgi:hypothetical protein